MKIVVLTSLFVGVLCLTSFAQPSKEPIEHEIQSKVFGTKRKISVCLPIEEEKTDKKQSYAVAFIFDGQFEPYTHMVNSMIQYYSGAGEGIPMIVVGIHTNERWEEFVPQLVNGQLVQGKASEQLSNFLSQEVIPFIDSEYPTTSFRLGVGHSLGGTFVLHEIMKETSIFNAVIAVSPNLTMYDEYLVKQGKIFFEKGTTQPRFIYTSAGTFGNMERLFNRSLSNLDSIYKKVGTKDIYWHCSYLEGENHMTTFVPTCNKGYLEMSSKLLLTDQRLLAMAADTSREMTDALKEFYREMSRFSGSEHVLTTEILMEYGKRLLDLEEYKALVTLSKSTKRWMETEKEDVSKDAQKKLDGRIEWGQFNRLAQEARELGYKEEYKSAAECYKKAFAMNVINGTHIVRIYSVEVLAQAGELELAFEQLNLLANTFELGGNKQFIANSLCDPLKNDPRWVEYMRKLEKNAQKYK